MSEFPPVHTDDDGSEFCVVATSSNEAGLCRLSDVLRKRLYPGEREWIDHLDDVLVRSGHTHQLLVRKDVWMSLYRGDRLRLDAFCEGWTQALDEH